MRSATEARPHVVYERTLALTPNAHRPIATGLSLDQGHIVKSWVAWILAATAVRAEVVCAAPQVPDVRASALELLWSTPIVADPPAPEVGKTYKAQRGKGLVLRAATSLADGQVVFLADLFDSSSFRHVLLGNAERHGPEGGVTELRLGRSTAAPRSYVSGSSAASARERQPSPLTLASNGADVLWMGGFANSYTGIASDTHADAFLAVREISGQPLWQRAYALGRLSAVTGIAGTPGGQIALVTTGGVASPGSLMLVDGTDGHVIWQRDIGNGKGAAVVSVDDAELIVASFESVQDPPGYREDIAVHTATLAGQISRPTIIRHEINTDRSAYYGSLRMVSREGGAYVVSSWENPFLSSRWQSPAVASVSASGTLLWSTSLPDGFAPVHDGGEVRFCTEPAIAALPNGDALVACALDEEIHLHRLDRDTGADRQGTLPLPSCNDGRHPVSLFLLVREDGTVLLSGTRPQGNVGPGCSWMARVVARHTPG
jgi:hypothetical protein